MVIRSWNNWSGVSKTLRSLSGSLSTPTNIWLLIVFIYLFFITFQAWPFAFQHGGSLSCSISQRWSVTTQPTESPNRTQIQNENTQNNVNCNDNYGQEYSENDYDDKIYEDMTTNEPNTCTPLQYSNYGYKGNYYEMRNYSSDSIVNN